MDKHFTGIATPRRFSVISPIHLGLFQEQANSDSGRV